MGAVCLDVLAQHWVRTTAFELLKVGWGTKDGPWGTTGR